MKVHKDDASVRMTMPMAVYASPVVSSHVHTINDDDDDDDVPRAFRSM